MGDNSDIFELDIPFLNLDPCSNSDAGHNTTTISFITKHHQQNHHGHLVSHQIEEPLNRLRGDQRVVAGSGGGRFSPKCYVGNTLGTNFCTLSLPNPDTGGFGTLLSNGVDTMAHVTTLNGGGTRTCYGDDDDDIFDNRGQGCCLVDHFCSKAAPATAEARTNTTFRGAVNTGGGTNHSTPNPNNHAPPTPHIDTLPSFDSSFMSTTIEGPPPGRHYATSTTATANKESSFTHQTSRIDGLTSDLTYIESLKQQRPRIIPTIDDDKVRDTVVTRSDAIRSSSSSSNAKTAVSSSYLGGEGLGNNPGGSVVVSENEIQSIINANISLLTTWQKQLQAMSSFYNKNILGLTTNDNNHDTPPNLVEASSSRGSPVGLGPTPSYATNYCNETNFLFNNISTLLTNNNNNNINNSNNVVPYPISNNATNNLLDLFHKVGSGNFNPVNAPPISVDEAAPTLGRGLDGVIMANCNATSLLQHYANNALFLPRDQPPPPLNHLLHSPATLAPTSSSSSSNSNNDNHNGNVDAGAHMMSGLGGLLSVKRELYGEGEEEVKQQQQQPVDQQYRPSPPNDEQGGPGNHNGSGLAVCSFCSKAFKFKSNLHTHVKAVHKKIKPHTCPVCGKNFSLKQNMKTHMKNIHLRLIFTHTTNSTSPDPGAPRGAPGDGAGSVFATYTDHVIKEEVDYTSPTQTTNEPATESRGHRSFDSPPPPSSSGAGEKMTFSSLEDQYRNLLLSAAAAQVAIFGSNPPCTASTTTTNTTTSFANYDYPFGHHGTTTTTPYYDDDEDDASNSANTNLLREQHMGMAIAAVASKTYDVADTAGRLGGTKGKKKLRITFTNTDRDNDDTTPPLTALTTPTDDNRSHLSSSYLFPAPPLPSPPTSSSAAGFTNLQSCLPHHGTDDKNSNENAFTADPSCIAFFDVTSSPNYRSTPSSSPLAVGSPLHTRNNTPRPVGAPRRNVTDNRDLIYCPQCPKTFTLKGNFNVHLKIVHEKVREFTCPFCHKRFGLKANMYMHIANVHKIRPNPNTTPTGPDEQLSEEVLNSKTSSPGQTTCGGTKRGRPTTRRTLPPPLLIPHQPTDTTALAYDLDYDHDHVDTPTTLDPQCKVLNSLQSPEDTDGMLAVASVYLQYLQQQQHHNDHNNNDDDNNDGSQSKRCSTNNEHLSAAPSPPDFSLYTHNLHNQNKSDMYNAYDQCSIILNQSESGMNEPNDGTCGRQLSSSITATVRDRRTSAI